MSETQTLSYAKALTATRLHIYQVLFTISIVVGLFVGLWSIFDPVGFAQLIFQIDPHPEAWPRIWGAMLLALQFLTYQVCAIRFFIAGPTGLASRLSF